MSARPGWLLMLSLPACSLTTSFDGLSGGADAGHASDANAASGWPDASALGPCVGNEGSCACDSGSSCSHECSAAACTIVCQESTSCTGSCNAGGCQFFCAPSASCQFDCSGGHCTFHCSPGASCGTTCDPGNCTNLQ